MSAFTESPAMVMPENLCLANLPPEAMLENTLSCKYIAGGPYANEATLAFFPVERLGLGKRDFFQKIDLR